MKTIHKYPLEVGMNILEVPYLKILNVINQYNKPTLYVIVDTEMPYKEIQVIVAGTGWELEDNVLDNNYVGTVNTGSFVWHVFYKEGI
jgi:hypothetical protein